jgi:predicted MFS family arabinose efflux permease
MTGNLFLFYDKLFDINTTKELDGHVGLFFFAENKMMKKLTALYFNSFKDLSREVWLLALITLINRAGTMVIPFLSLYLTESLSYTFADVGWIMTAFGLGSVSGSWLGGKLADKFGAYRTMVLSLTLSGILFILMQYVHTFEGFCIGIFILMLIADIFRPALFVALSAYSKPENKTRSVTLIRLAINLGFSAGPAIGGLIITQLSYAGLFWLDGITCIAAGLLLYFLLNPKRAIVLTDNTVINPKSAYNDRKYWVFIVATVLFATIFLQLFSTVPIYYKKVHHLTEWEIGLLFGANGLLIFLVEMPLIKWLENSRKSKISLVIIGVLLIVASFIALNLTGWTGMLILSMLLVTVGEMIAFPFSNAFAMDRSSRGNQGEYMALYSIAFSIAHIFGHNVGLRMIEQLGFTSTWYYFALLGMVSVASLAFLKRIKD